MTSHPKRSRKEPDARLEKDAIAMQESLAELVRVYQFRDRQRICFYDVSVTQCYAISLLMTVGPTTLNRLATELYLDKSTASRVVDSLEQKGYVRREVEPSDGRALRLEVTPDGKKLHFKIERDLIEQMKDLLEGFSPGTRREGARLLAKLAEAARIRS